MESLVMFVLGLAFLAVICAAYGIFVALPRLLWAQLAAMWATFGRASRIALARDGEPAVPAYPCVTGPRDLLHAWRESFAGQRRVLTAAERFLPGITTPSGQGPRPLPGCLAIVLYPVLAASVATALLITAALSVLPLLSVLLVWAVSCLVWAAWYALWLLIARVDRAVRGAGRPALCPYANCAGTIVRPLTLCPNCRAQHAQVEPNAYGVLAHRCRCGARLPTVIGRGRLDTCCPHCTGLLPKGWHRARVVLIVGPSAGRRAQVQRRGLTALGVPAARGVPLARTAGRPLLLHSPPGGTYATQAALDGLDALRHADGLLLLVSDPAPYGADAEAVIRVLRAVETLPARRRRYAVLYAGAAEDTDVRGQLTASGGGHLLRVLEATGGEVRCVAADDPGLDATLLWASSSGAGRASAADAHLAPPSPPGEPGEHVRELPRHRPARHTLLLAHVMGYLALPLAFVVLQSGVLPAASLHGLPRAYDRWRHPLTATVHEVDILAHTTADWPRITGDYSAPGTSPRNTLPGHAGYWSVKGAPKEKDALGLDFADNWFRLDFGLPLPLSEVSYDWDPDSTEMWSPVTMSVEGQLGSSTFFPSHEGVRDHKQAEGKNMTKTYGRDYPLRRTADAVRFSLSSLPGGAEARARARLREVNVRWTSSDALRLRPLTDGALRIENTLDRPLDVAVQPPILPSGRQARLLGPATVTLDAHRSYTARWRLTAPHDAQGPSPIAYAVNATDDGRTVTTRCLALLTGGGTGVRPLC
ncbi:hypothetical protein ACIBUY_02840 [Streptomyces sp. NPDC050085]|uniref:hypothetical protein n=1 Tax=Streptomyces sp. NPDC050085 TaxID=3365600 RepID=UPI0037B8957B